MTTYMIGYDLNKQARPDQYKELFEEIKALANGWWHHLDSTWLVNSTLTAAQIRDRLAVHLDQNDELLVAKISAPAAWSGFNSNGSDWLRANL